MINVIACVELFTDSRLVSQGNIAERNAHANSSRIRPFAAFQIAHIIDEL